MKVKVVSRAFFDDAYLDFFLGYYLGLGFDNITILKADTDLFDYKLPDYLKGEEKGKITIVPVKNEGNAIVRTNFKYYKDDAYDWVLNIDSDELLVIGLNKYPNGIKDYITETLERVKTQHELQPDELQQIQFRWLCINKMNIDFSDNLQILNNLPHPDENLYQLSTSKTLLNDYILSNKLEFYRYVKSMATPKQMTDEGSALNCHFFPLKHISNATTSINHNILLDNYFVNRNSSDPRSLRKDKKAMNWGFILHLNTRSLANAVTKCLVTQLRANKKISNLDAFKQFINTCQIIPLEDILDRDNTEMVEKRKELKNNFMSYLNSKRFFPKKIRAYHNRVQKFIPEENYLPQLSSVINRVDICNTIPFVNLDKEMEILEGLCQKNSIQFEKMKWLLSLF
jgi:hypothetical protein